MVDKRREMPIFTPTRHILSARFKDLTDGKTNHS